jgi:four helix bundle protein
MRPAVAAHDNAPRSSDADRSAPAAHDDASVRGPAPVLDAEKLVAYRLALELQVLVGTLIPPQHRVLADQLERASLSVVLNIAEAAGRRSRKDKRRFIAIARGSATETAAAIDVLRLRRLGPEAGCAGARHLALRVVQVLTKLDAALG